MKKNTTTATENTAPATKKNTKSRKENTMSKKTAQNVAIAQNTTEKEEKKAMPKENIQNVTTAAEPVKTAEKKEKTMNKRTLSLIADIEAITPAYGDRLQTLSVDELVALRRMLKERSIALAKEVHTMDNAALTGQYTDALDALVNIVYNAIPEIMRGSFTIHADPKKKKLMVRWTGKSMLFKVFIQKKNVKVHLKNEADWAAVPFEHTTPFYQNGFNLPYAVKMSEDDFTQKFLPYIFTTV